MTDSSNVSVIIVSFQSDAALMSLFPSIPENVELIIVNNSPDQNLEKLKKIKKFKEIKNPENVRTYFEMGLENCSWGLRTSGWIKITLQI